MSHKRDEDVLPGAQEAFWQAVEVEVFALLRKRGPMPTGGLLFGLSPDLLIRGKDVEVPLSARWLRYRRRAIIEAGKSLVERDGRFEPFEGPRKPPLAVEAVEAEVPAPPPSQGDSVRTDRPGRPQPCRDSPDTASVRLRSPPKAEVACLRLLNHDPRTLRSTGTDLDAVEPTRNCMRTALARRARLARDWRESRRERSPAAMAEGLRPTSTRERSVEDFARYGGGLGGAHVTERHASGNLATGCVRSMP